MAHAPFTFHRSGRSVTGLMVVLGVWAVLAAAWFWLEAALWVLAILAAFTLPALIDLIHNPESGLTLSDETLRWYSGRRRASVDLAEIDHIRLDTRLDFSVRASAILHTGRRIRLPFESTPPDQAFEAALQERSVKTLRFHFQLFQ